MASARPSIPDRNLHHGGEIERCRDDFGYFARSYLKIVDRNGNLIPLVLKPAQEKLLAAVRDNPWQIVLKARQLGSSTAIAAYFFWQALFTPNHRVLVVAHTGAAVQNLFRIYEQFHAGLPAFLQFPTKHSSGTQIVFFHGGTVRVASSIGQSFRGATYNSLHCSEAAFWKDMSQTVAGLFQTASGNSTIIVETTPSGLNQFYQLWADKNNGFGKLFLSWLDEPDYCLGGRWAEEVPQQLQAYAVEHGLSEGQLQWACQTLAVRCANSFVTFLQEYAADPVSCFTSSGTRFFKQIWPQADMELGYRRYLEPSKRSVYVLGADVASGAPHGDFSAYCVLDVTDESRPLVAACWVGYATPIEFARSVLSEAQTWDALVVVESNSYGLAVIEFLRDAEWGKLFTQQRFNFVEKTWTEKIGFTTSGQSRGVMLSRLQAAVDSGALALTDRRLQFQANTFVYAESGRPDHLEKAHDDLLFACGFALMGSEQACVEAFSEKRPKPQSVAEMVEIEIKTGKTVAMLQQEGFFVDSSDDEIPGSFSALRVA
jgi:hypothetical protein